MRRQQHILHQIRNKRVQPNTVNKNVQNTKSTVKSTAPMNNRPNSRTTTPMNNRPNSRTTTPMNNRTNSRNTTPMNNRPNSRNTTPMNNRPNSRNTTPINNRTNVRTTTPINNRPSANLKDRISEIDNKSRSLSVQNKKHEIESNLSSIIETNEEENIKEIIKYVKGPQGPIGPQGPQGEPGKDAITNSVKIVTSQNIPVLLENIESKLNEILKICGEKIFDV
jgi:hypothetical protein